MSGVPAPKVVATPPSDSVWSVDFWFRKIIKIVARSQKFAPHSISVGAVRSAPGPPRKAYSVPSALAEPQEV